MEKVVSLVEREKNKCTDKVLEIINILEDYDITIDISQENIRLILSKLYDLYMKKQIAYQFKEDMLLYFNEICRDVLDEEEVFNFESISNGFMGCYDIMIPVGIEKEDFGKVFQKVEHEIDSGRQKSEE